MPERIEWIAPSHEHIEHGTDWYWALGVLALAGAAIAILLGNPLFAVIIILGAFSLGVVSSRAPRDYNVHIDSRGITLDDNLYLFRSLDSFFVDTETRDVPHLIVSSRGILLPQLIIPLREVNPEEIRSFLVQYLEEKEQYESPLTRVSELLGL